MLKIKLLIGIGIVFIFIACGSVKKVSKSKDDNIELEFYTLFIDATKFAVQGDYKKAVAYYKECIRRFPEKAASYYQISNIYLSASDIETAKKYARRSAEIDDKNKWYLLHLANIYQFENNLDSVIYLYEKITKISNSQEYRYNLSVFYAQNGEYKKSMKVIKDLEREMENTKEILILKHRNYDALKMRDSALVQLESLVKIFPDEFENYGLLAEYLSELKMFEYAQNVYKDLLEIEPESGLANISYGDFFLQQEIKDSALIYYKRGFESDDILLVDKLGIIFKYLYDPVVLKEDTIFVEALIEVLKNNYTDSKIYTLSAEYYVKRKKYNDAAEELKKAIEMGSNEYIVWEQFIMLNNYLKNYKEVENYYEEAIRKFSDKSRIYVYSVYSLYENGKYDSALSICDSALKLDNIDKSDKIQILNVMADVYRVKKNYSESDSLFEKLLILDSENMIIRNNYSYYLSLRSENLERAEELSKVTIKAEPENATYLDTYGWIMFKMGKEKEAKKYVEEAIKRGAFNNGEVLDHYGEIMRKLLRCGEAIEAWREAIKYDSENIGKYQAKIEETEKYCNE